MSDLLRTIRPVEKPNSGVNFLAYKVALTRPSLLVDSAPK